MLKLHLGCGNNILDGWLNTDISSTHKDVMLLDVTQELFPFEDNSIDYIYSEHLLEHINYAQGTQMLKECFRILKPGAKIRVTCPDIQFLIDLYTNPTDFHKKYIEWACNESIIPVPFKHPLFVVNQFVRSWGHKFIYDKDVLKKTLEIAGFQKIKEFTISDSDDPNLQNLENQKRLPEGFLQLESMTFEAEKLV